MKRRERKSDTYELAMLILLSVQDDYEAIPQIVKSLNNTKQYRQTWQGEITTDLVIVTIERLVMEGMLQAWRGKDGRLVPIVPSEIGDLRTEANTVYSVWPRPGSLWFKPTDKGQRAYEEWAAIRR